MSEPTAILLNRTPAESASPSVQGPPPDVVDEETPFDPAPARPERPPWLARPVTAPSEGGAVVQEVPNPRDQYSRCMLVACSSAAAKTPCLRGGPSMGECCCNTRLLSDGTPQPQPTKDQWAVLGGGPPTPVPVTDEAPSPRQVFASHAPGPGPVADGGPWAWPAARPASPYYAPPGYAAGWPAAAVPPAPAAPYAPAPVIYGAGDQEQTISANDFRVHIEGTGFSWGVQRT